MRFMACEQAAKGYLNRDVQRLRRTRRLLHASGPQARDRPEVLGSADLAECLALRSPRLELRTEAAHEALVDALGPRPGADRVRRSCGAVGTCASRSRSARSANADIAFVDVIGSV